MKKLLKWNKQKKLRNFITISLIILVVAGPILLSEDPSAFKPQQAQQMGLPAGGPFEYVVVGSTSIESIVGRLINWKQLRGLTAGFVSIQYINQSYTGLDLAEKVRNFCLEANATWNTKYLLLIGVEPEIPIRYLYAPDPHYDDVALSNWTDNLVPSDQYFSGISTNWDDDGDLRYGEDPNEADWAADIYVGRIPLSNPVDIQDAVDRIIQYELGPLTGAINESLLLGSILQQQQSLGNFLTDANGTKYTAEILLPLLEAAGLNTTQLYEWETGTSPPPPSNLTDLEFKWLIGNYSYALINIMANGKINELGRSYTDFTSGWNSLLTTLQAGSYNFSGNPLMVLGYGITAGIDHNTTGDPSRTPLAISLMQNLNGPIAVIGYTRGAWYTPGNNTETGMAALLNMYFWQNFLNRTDYRAAPAFYQAKEVFSHLLSGASSPAAERIWKLLCAQMYIGDPETPIWWNTTKQVEIDAPPIVFEDSLIQIRITNSTGTGLNNSLIRIQDDSGIINEVTTNITGYAWLRVPSTIGNYSLYAEHADYDYA